MNSGLNAPGPSCDDYCTPAWLWKALDGEFGLTFDAAASKDNALCAEWCDDLEAFLEGNRLSNQRVFCNPPYSNIGLFVHQALASDLLWVLLLPVRTDTDWFRALVESGRAEFRYFRKRIRFHLGGEVCDSPRFASMVVVLRPTQSAHL